jgi:hypothetical protein
MSEPKLTPDDEARLTAAIQRCERDFADHMVWCGSDVRHAPLPRNVLTARDIYKRIFGVDMPSNVTATWEGSTVTFSVEPTVAPFEVSFFGVKDAGSV